MDFSFSQEEIHPTEL